MLFHADDPHIRNVKIKHTVAHDLLAECQGRGDMYGPVTGSAIHDLEQGPIMSIIGINVIGEPIDPARAYVMDYPYIRVGISAIQDHGQGADVIIVGSFNGVLPPGS